MNVSSALPVTPTPTLSLRERLQLVPPARIIAAVEESPDLLTLGDLRQYSKFLANEFCHQADVAASHPATWYAEQIELCTPAQGETVRTMTIELCSEVALYSGYNQAMLAGGVRRAEALDAFGFVMVMLILFLVIPLLWRGHEPIQPEEWQPRTPAAVQAVGR